MHLVEQRDPDFWMRIASLPECENAMIGATPEQVAALAANRLVRPLATPDGGFLFVSRDAFGLVWELHTLFARPAWGRPVHDAALWAFEEMFGEGEARLIVTMENTRHWRTRPPRTFGFKPVGAPQITDWGEFRLWVLAVDDWKSSIARQKWEV